MSEHAKTPSVNQREWIERLVTKATDEEIVQCMNDLLDRAEFAEEMARRGIVERLAAAMQSWEENMGWSGPQYAEVQSVLAEVGALRAR